MFLKWIGKNLRPSLKIAAISRAVVDDFRKCWTFDGEVWMEGGRIRFRIGIEPKDTDGDGVPDIDELAE